MTDWLPATWYAWMQPHNLVYDMIRFGDERLWLYFRSPGGLFSVARAALVGKKTLSHR